MRRMLLVLIISTACCWVYGCADDSLIANNGNTDYRIVIPDNASEPVQYAAEELQRFVREMTDAELPIIKDSEPSEKHEIVLGNANRLKESGIDVNFDDLGEEGYVLKTSGSRLFIAGGEPRGTLYGVYGLLEEKLGCRWFTPEISHIPSLNKLALPLLDETVVPILEYREPYIWDAKDGDWAARNRINRNTSRGTLDTRHGGQYEWVPGFFVHTFERLVPKAEFYDEHPEYFSLVKGVRMKELSQLCCTNEDVIRIVTERTLQAFRDHPEANILSVDQNDCYNFCECEHCQAIAEQEGSQMGPVLYLVNKVADAVAEEFPDKAVVTLAYQWTRHATKQMRPRDNVIIRLCSIECCFTHPFNECDDEDNISFTQDVIDWGKMSNRLWVWNYTTDFSHYLLPFPNLPVRAKNLQLFVENHVTGMFQQDTPNIPHGEFSELGAYVHAKLLWNPYYDTDTAIVEFCDAYYGAASEQIRGYLDFIHNKAVERNIHMGCYESPETDLLDGDFFEVAATYFDAAEEAVADDPVLLERVKASRLSPMYAWVARGVSDKAYIIDQENLRVDISNEYIARLDEFLGACRHYGIEYLDEKGLTLDQFRENVLAGVSAQTLTWMPAVSVDNTEQGISFSRYIKGWDETPLFSGIEPVETGTIDTITLPNHEAQELFGMVYEGYIDIPRDGVYALYTYCDDGSMLYIDDRLIVNNGGRHAMVEKVGFAALKKGKHKIRTTWFNAAGGLGLEAYIKGPGMEKQDIPAGMVYH